MKRNKVIYFLLLRAVLQQQRKSQSLSHHMFSALLLAWCSSTLTLTAHCEVTHQPQMGGHFYSFRQFAGEGILVHSQDAKLICLSLPRAVQITSVVSGVRSVCNEPNAWFLPLVQSEQSQKWLITPHRYWSWEYQLSSERPLSEVEFTGFTMELGASPGKVGCISTEQTKWFVLLLTL